jgi:hypothetical protein
VNTAWCRQELAGHKRLGFGLGKGPESIAATDALGLGRASGGDSGEPTY